MSTVGLAYLLLATACIALAILPWWRRLRVGGIALSVAVLLFLMCLTLSAVVLVTGLLGVLRPVPVLILSALGAAAALIPATPRMQIAGVLAHARRAVQQHRWLVLGTSISLLPIVIRSAVHAWCLPPFVTDVMTYHLPKVADWVRSGSLDMVETSIPRAWWPAGFELLQTWCCLFSHHDGLVELAGLPFMAIAYLSVWAIARQVGCRRMWSLLAATIYIYTPGVVLNSISGKNDVAIASLFLLAVALAVDLWACPRRPGRSFVWLLAVLAAAVGIKPSIVFMAPGLVAIVAWCWCFRQQRTDGSWLIPVGAAASLLTIAMVVGAFWYVRNYVLFANPFHPTDFRLFGGLIFGSGHGHGQQGALSLHGLGANLTSMLQTRLWDRKLLGSELPYAAGWGWCVMGLGLASAVWALIRCLRIVASMLSLTSSVIFVHGMMEFSENS